jgi:hypothetical protein
MNRWHLKIAGQQKQKTDSGKMMRFRSLGLFALILLLFIGCMGPDVENLKSIAYNGYGEDWAKLTTEEQLIIAEIVIHDYEQEQSKDIPTEPSTILIGMEQFNYGKGGSFKDVTISRMIRVIIAFDLMFRDAAVPSY